MSRSPQEVLDMAEKRTTYKLQDVGGIGEVKIADEVVTVIAGLAATEVDGVASMGGNITNELVSKLGVKNMFAATVADTLLQQTVQSNSLQDNAEDDTTMQSIDMSSALEDEETISPNIQISLGLEDLLRLYCIGFFIIVVSVTVSSVSVMRLKPRDILNRMS